MLGTGAVPVPLAEQPLQGHSQSSCGNMDSTGMFSVGCSPLILEPLVEPQQSWLRERSPSYLIPASVWKNTEPKKKGGKSHTYTTLGNQGT